MFKLLKNVFGHDSFRAFQKDAVDAILNKRDLITILPTGGGKSLCYQLPSLLLEGTAIVVSPLIALMQDQVLALKNNGIKAEMMNSSQGLNEIHDITENLQKGNIKLLYVAPERLSNLSFVELLKKIKISFFVIDEAHCVSEWGHEFRLDYRNLSMLKNYFPHATIAAFTATATHLVQEDIVKTLQLDNPLQLRGTTLRENLFVKAEKRVGNGRVQLVKFLSQFVHTSGIVYAFSRKDVEATAEFLAQKGFKVAAYHAGLSSQVREKAYHDFLYENVDIVVATIAFGMGIDKSNIRFVVHMSMPKTMENYYQEIGRAGRDGLASETLLLYTKADEIQRRMLIDDLPDEQYKALMYAKLGKMYSYANTSECRHRLIAKYFDDAIQRCEDLCDNCKNPEIDKVDITTESMKLLSAIYRCNQSFGLNHIIDVLRGSKSQKIYQFHHEKLSVYEIGKEKSKNEWSAVADRLFELDAICIGEHRAIKITQVGLDIMKQKFLVEIDIHKLGQDDKNMTKQIYVANNELFEELKALRREIAMQENVPAYVVFSDKTLLELSQKTPKNKNEMLQINGIGEVKFQRYGERFLNLFMNRKLV